MDVIIITYTDSTSSSPPDLASPTSGESLQLSKPITLPLHVQIAWPLAYKMDYSCSPAPGLVAHIVVCSESFKMWISTAFILTQSPSILQAPLTALGSRCFGQRATRHGVRSEQS